MTDWRHRARDCDEFKERWKTGLEKEDRRNKGAVLPSYVNETRGICTCWTRHGPMRTKLLQHLQGAYPTLLSQAAPGRQGV